MRDNNKVANNLTKEAQDDEEKLFVHMDPPIYVRKLLEDDIYRIMGSLPDEI